MAGTLVKRIEFTGGREFCVVIHNLLAEPVDCIVNAANGMLAHGGGVAAAIAGAAGPRLVEEGNELIRKRGVISVGDAVVTTAGDLPFKGVIHAVGLPFHSPVSVQEYLPFLITYAPVPMGRL
ncbi:MAG: macro domain-containing protein [Deltaproteobacteria bacterium]|nr:macro domain-containing protein [Deltaproteobacteria bacterium]